MWSLWVFHLGILVSAARMEREDGKENVEVEDGGFLASVNRKLLGTSDLLGLLKWNTPTVYNG